MKYVIAWDNLFICSLSPRRWTKNLFEAWKAATYEKARAELERHHISRAHVVEVRE